MERTKLEDGMEAGKHVDIFFNSFVFCAMKNKPLVIKVVHKSMLSISSFLMTSAHASISITFSLYHFDLNILQLHKIVHL